MSAKDHLKPQNGNCRQHSEHVEMQRANLMGWPVAKQRGSCPAQCSVKRKQGGNIHYNSSLTEIKITRTGYRNKPTP
jgi:hypothetical protein